MGRMHFEQPLAAPPGAVWPHVTEPERMNHWSEAKVRLIEAGVPGRPDSVGTLREVCIPTWPVDTVLREQVVESDPAASFRYRVIKGGLLREHQGHIQLRPEGVGCRLSWTVDFKPWLPGTGWVAKWIVSSAMRRSLLALAEQVRTP